MTVRYEILVAATPSPLLDVALEEFEMTPTDTGHLSLVGTLVDEAALHGPSIAGKNCGSRSSRSAASIPADGSPVGLSRRPAFVAAMLVHDRRLKGASGTGSLS